MKKLLSFLKCDRKTAAEVVAAFLIGVSGGWIHVCFGDSMAWGDYVLLFLAVCGLYCLYAHKGLKFTSVTVATFFIGILSADASVRYLGLSFGSQIKLASFALFVSGSIVLYFLYRRTITLEEQTNNQYTQIEIQIRKEIDDRFNTASASLGSDHTSARTGAIYSLYHLARDDYKGDQKYCHAVPRILCSHIRDITGGAEYQDGRAHQLKPSNEIQAAIDLLFKRDGDMEGLYPLFNRGGVQLASADLSGAYLAGADFTDAHLVDADFYRSICHSANFSDAVCVGANFESAKMISVSFEDAALQSAHFEGAKCYAANFASAQFQMAEFKFAKFHGANFEEAGFQGTYVRGVHFQGCKLCAAEFQGALFADYSPGMRQEFYKPDFSGAYAGRVGDELHRQLHILEGDFADLSTVKFAGPFSKRAIDSIQSVDHFLSEDARKKLKRLIEKHATADNIVGTSELQVAREKIKARNQDEYGLISLHDDMKTGQLTDEEISRVRPELREWDDARRARR